MFLVVPIIFLTALTLASVIQNKQGFPQSPTKHIQHQQIFIYTCCVNSNNTSIIIFRWGPKLNGSLPEPFQLYSRASVKKGVRNWHLNNVWSEQFNISRYKDRVEVTLKPKGNMVCMSWKIQMLQPGDDNAFHAAYRNDESSGGQFKLCNGKVQVVNSKDFQPTVGPTHNVPTESTTAGKNSSTKENGHTGKNITHPNNTTDFRPTVGPTHNAPTESPENDKLLLLLLLLLVPIIAGLYCLLQRYEKEEEKKAEDNNALETLKEETDCKASDHSEGSLPASPDGIKPCSRSEDHTVNRKPATDDDVPCDLGNTTDK